MKKRLCKDCLTEPGLRPSREAPHPGPRCATHHRAEKKRRQEAAHGHRILNGYGITTGQYLALYEAQGRHCAICEVATGKVKRLAVDHNHETGEVRGLLCGRCNRVIAIYGTAKLRRAINYLENPPARAVLNPNTEEPQ